MRKRVEACWQLPTRHSTAWRVRGGKHTWMPEVSINRAMSLTFSTSAQSKHTASGSTTSAIQVTAPYRAMYYSLMSADGTKHPMEGC